MTRFLIAALFGLALPGPAVALSCLAWDAETVYRAAAEAEERYVIALGSFQRTDPDRGTGANPGGPEPYSYPARFTGSLASRIGFRTPADLLVDMRVNCVASWCGSAPEDGRQMLVFLQVDDNREYSLDLDACSFWAIPEPDRAALDQIIQCMRGGC